MNKYNKNKLFPNYPNDAIDLAANLINSDTISRLDSLVGTASMINEKMITELLESLKALSETAIDSAYSIMNDISLRCTLSIVDSSALSAVGMSILSSCAESFQTFAKEAMLALSSITNIDIPEDYVIIDESSIEEFEFPDSIALPIGNKRIRVKTEIIISFLVTLVVSLVSFIQSEYHEKKSLEAERQYYASKLQESQKQSQMLEQLIDSIDYSESAHADSIEALTKSIQSLTESFRSSELTHPESDSTSD